MSAVELEALGYRWTGRAWVLVVPDARPPSRPGLCKACGKFDGHPDWDGLCAGCLWYGPGDPHGIERERAKMRIRRRLRERGRQ
jgi:hypothetical protein